MQDGVLSEILKSIRAGGSNFKDESYFNKLACDLFRFQKKRNHLYRNYCLKINANKNPNCWEEIPFLPIHAFKIKSFYSGISSRPKLKFLSSGTSLGEARSCHWMEKSNHYDAVIDQLVSKRFSNCISNAAFASLIPAASERPESSLSYMISRISRKKWFNTRFFAISKDAVRFDDLTEYLRKCGAEKKRVLFMTTTLALTDYCKWLKHRQIQLKLPAHSMLMDTGGYKGRQMSTTRTSFLNEASKRLGVSKRQIVNEYGMSELSSQFYDRPNSDIKDVPDWCRVAILNPKTHQMSTSKGRGMIRIVDLANVWSCAFVQTEDVGLIQAGGIQLLGRASGSGLRGCSISYEEMKRGK